jgi:hypothetical protein
VAGQFARQSTLANDVDHRAGRIDDDPLSCDRERRLDAGDKRILMPVIGPDADPTPHF